MADKHDGGRSRPNLALDSLSFTEEMLTWSFVESRMHAAQNYWIVSAAASGRPHAVPVWGAWLDDVFYFVGAGRKIRNLRANPQAAVHLESADEVVIIEGSFQEIKRRDEAFLHRLDNDFVRKYETYRPSENLDNAGSSGNVPVGLFAVFPTTVIAWSGFARNATRWRIPRE